MKFFFIVETLALFNHWRFTPAYLCQETLSDPLENLEFATPFALVLSTGAIPNIFRRRRPQHDFAQPNFVGCL